MKLVPRSIAGWLQRRRRAAETRRALQLLDSRALHDIGLDSSEIASVAAELAGCIERQRIGRLVGLI